MKIFQVKFTTRLVFLFLGVFLLSSMASFAQSLEGKWNIAKMDTKRSRMIEFTKDSLIFYEFDKRHSATSYEVSDNRITVSDASIPINGTYEFVNAQRLRLKPDRAKRPIDFVRLKPTKTSLTKAEIENLNFTISYKNHPLTVNFDRVEEGSGKTTKLEKIDATYFLSFYQNDQRLGAIPIEQVTTEEISVYGFPEKPYVVTGELVSSNGNSTSANTASSQVDLNTTEAIIGKWFYKSIKGRTSLSNCTKKTFFQFTKDASLQIKPYAKNHSNGNCIAGDSLNGTYNLVTDDQIEVTQNGKTNVWKIQSLTNTKLVVERDGGVLTLIKK
ncbi:Lipocalin-like domain-containing protein [Salegentibacter echinorum]|uniref:Lipocalin-like domain-containing protein n=1 Tax=Salegentibacter echinorum TaxID=1073325 RepID=A0A1M5IQK2_SALEC|nr:lipocalin family protein [Salegentibacter echinorum]SHG30506.1 Lipocalin-like domain-containing protein [Salegentibacter echinorum]